MLQKLSLRNDYEEWLSKDLLVFPAIQPLIHTQKVENRRIYDRFLKENFDRKSIDKEEQIKRIDTNLNMKRLLNEDHRYLASFHTRNLVQESTNLEPRLVRKIFHDARLIAKYKKSENVNLLDKLKLNLNRSMDSYFSNHRCDRFIKHDRTFENKMFRKAMQCGVDLSALKTQKSTSDSKNTKNIIEKTSQAVKLPSLIQKNDYQFDSTTKSTD
jgi:hypothetical protein